ncbi:MAG: cytochrome P450 [Myxococcota bacterium]
MVDFTFSADDAYADSPYRVVLDRAGTRTPEHPTRPEIRLLDPAFYADPHPHFRWMREHAPVYWDDATGIWGLARYAEVMAVSKDWKTFGSGKGSRPDSSVPSMINFDPPEHNLRRRIVSAGFTPRRVADHEPFLRRKVGELFDAVADQGRCDFVRDIATPLPMYMIGELMGLPEADHEQLLHWSDLFATGGDEVRAELPEAVLAYAEYIKRAIAERRGGSGEDLVSLVVHAEIDGRKLAEDDLIFETMLVLVGGDETTRHVISGGLEALLRSPEQLAALRDDRSLLPGAIEEMLRWVTPIQNMNRTASRDVELGGQAIREGDRLLLLYPSANRDARVFPEPDRFDIRRTPNDHVAFGGFGRHHCLGAQLARLELRVVFDELLDRWTEVALEAPDTPLPRRRGNFVLGFEAMPVRFRPR